eukprot:3433965-Ditylum_brightwellii.AAC.1
MTIDIANGLRRARANNKEIVQEWETKYQKEEDNKNGINTVPKFMLYVGNKKWGPVHDQLEAPVVIIQCTVKDAPYLKTMMSAAAEQGAIKQG